MCNTLPGSWHIPILGLEWDDFVLGEVKFRVTALSCRGVSSSGYEKEEEVKISINTTSVMKSSIGGQKCDATEHCVVSKQLSHEFAFPSWHIPLFPPWRVTTLSLPNQDIEMIYFLKELDVLCSQHTCDIKWEHLRSSPDFTSYLVYMKGHRIASRMGMETRGLPLPLPSMTAWPDSQTKFCSMK